jgi:hypothetical protein
MVIALPGHASSANIVYHAPHTHQPSAAVMHSLHTRTAGQTMVYGGGAESAKAKRARIPLRRKLQALLAPVEGRITEYIRRRYPTECGGEVGGKGEGRACTPCYSLLRRRVAPLFCFSRCFFVFSFVSFYQHRTWHMVARRTVLEHAFGSRPAGGLNTSDGCDHTHTLFR